VCSPLAPLPRWSEGNRSQLSFSKDNEFRHYILRSSIIPAGFKADAKWLRVVLGSRDHRAFCADRERLSTMTKRFKRQVEQPCQSPRDNSAPLKGEIRSF
jgi:hypothetical protein